MFTIFHKQCDSSSVYFVQHPIANEEYNKLPLLFGFVHLQKYLVHRKHTALEIGRSTVKHDCYCSLQDLGINL